MDNVMKYKGYYTKVNYSAKDDIMYGKLEGIEDFVLFDAESISEFRRAFETSVDDYLESCEEFGREPQKTYSGNFNVRVPSELHRDIAEMAMLMDESLNSVVEEALRAYVQANGEKDVSTSNSWNAKASENQRDKKILSVA